ncbi:hypothetical protein Q8814_07525 [Rhodococcus sp. CC-R104]|uniref:Uncharacterized protein n=1 Tax=Rhodococcus chondri TaxID=3065941 RepID=A0ABU7JPY3_9NOCA|nr:hypothetical protein [Rhodococcus sp. CC-R104]MEE2031959.1 hypothetical protein [Rhodococcus sp. CC-R104]
MDDFSALSPAATALLRTRGPLGSRELARALSEQGFGDAEQIANALEFGDALDDPVVAQTDDGRFVALDAVLEGRVFTHRLTSAEIDADAIAVFDVLLPVCIPSLDTSIRVAMPGIDDDILHARGLTDVAWAQFGVVLLPEGFLAGSASGELIAATVHDGAMVVEPRPEQNVQAGTLGRWLATVTAHLPGPEGAAYLETDLLDALVRDPALAADTCRPVSEQLSEFGLARSGNRLTAASASPERVAEESDLVAAAGQSFARAFELDAASARAAMSFLALVGSLVGEDSVVDGATVDSHFGDPDDFRALADPHTARVCVPTRRSADWSSRRGAWPTRANICCAEVLELRARVLTGSSATPGRPTGILWKRNADTVFRRPRTRISLRPCTRWRRSRRWAATAPPACCCSSEHPTGPTIRCIRFCSISSRSSDRTWGETTDAGAGPAASTRCVISARSTPRCPSGRCGCTPRQV